MIKMSHIFVSYSRQDKRVVQLYVESLRKQDFIVWQDVSNITAGEKWHQAILDAVENASAVIVFWSLTASQSKYVKEEIDYAIEHSKLIIPIWLNTDVPLCEGLKESNALITSSHSPGMVQKLVASLLETTSRIQRNLTDFKINLPMNEQSVEGLFREVIGSREYIVAPLVQSVYSDACLIAEADTIVNRATRIQLIVQNTGATGYAAPRGAFDAILAEDKEYPDDAQPLVGLYVTGAVNPLNKDSYWIDNTNVAHYSDMIDTANKAIQHIATNSRSTPVFQLFQKTLVDISFLLGIQVDRWIPFQLYKWDGSNYIPIINIPPRSPNT